MVIAELTLSLPVTDENRKTIEALVRSGHSLRLIANGKPEAPNAPEKKVRRHRRRAPDITPEQLTQMLALAEKGLTYRIIARRFGLSVSGCGNAIRKAKKKQKP